MRIGARMRFLTPMVGFCDPATGYGLKEGIWNPGRVNVKVWLGKGSNGQAVDVGYPSYNVATSETTG